MDERAGARADYGKIGFLGTPIVETYTEIRFANGLNQPIPMTIWLDDLQKIGPVAFEPTGSWENWRTKVLPHVGQVSLIADTDLGGPLLDEVKTVHVLGSGYDYLFNPNRDCPSLLPGVPALDPLPPKVSFTQTPESERGAAEYTFTSTSTDRNYDQLSLTWEFNDGTTYTGESVTKYLDSNVYAVRLTATDPTGLEDSLVEVLKIFSIGDEEVARPEIKLSNTPTFMIDPNSFVSLDAGTSSSPSGRPLSFLWLKGRISSYDTFDNSNWITTPQFSKDIGDQNDFDVSLFVSDGISFSDESIRFYRRERPSSDCEVHVQQTSRYSIFTIEFHNLTGSAKQGDIFSFAIPDASNINARVTDVYNYHTIRTNQDGSFTVSTPPFPPNTTLRINILTDPMPDASPEDVVFLDGLICTAM